MRNGAASLACALVFGLAAPLGAQTGRGLDPAKPISLYVHNAWTLDNGLPQNSVFSITQGRDGYLWFGTEAGLVRFDGLAFTTFNTTTLPGLGDNYINAVLIDRADTVWAGNWGGGVARVSRGAAFPAPSADTSQVNFMFEDRDGTVWVARESGLGRWQDGRFQTVPGGTGRFFSTISQLADGTLLFGTGEGLAVWRDGRVAPWQPPGGTVSGSVISLSPDTGDGVWIGMTGTVVHAAGGRLQRFGTNEGVPEGGVNAMLVTRHGQLWIGTEHGGIARLSGGRFEAFSARDGLTDDAAIALFEDREGSLWVGTRHGGLNRFREPLLTLYDTRQGLASNIVWSVYGDGRDLWVGTTKGLDRYRDGRFVSAIASGRSVYSTYRTRDGDFWISTAAGISRLRGGRWQLMGEPFPQSPATAFLEDRAGGLWIGGYFGLVRWKDGRLTDYTSEAGISSARITITEAADGTIWIGTRGYGVLRYAGGRFTHFTRREGLLSDVVESLHLDEHGLWLGTQAGLALLQGGRITALPFGGSVVMTDIYQIVADNRGHLWLTSNEGLMRVSTQELLDAAAGRRGRVEPEEIVPLDGRGRIEFNGASQTAGWRSDDGRLWFPSIRGLVVVDPARLRGNALPPPVHIERLLVDGRPVAVGPNLVLPPGGGGLELHYTATSLFIPERVTFRYRLDGYDEDWVDAGTRRVAYYTHVPGGTYHFRVMAANNDGVWNEAGTVLTFRLTPHFWETWWFRVLLGLVLVAAIAFGFRLRVRSIRQTSEQLGLLVEERTSELRAEVAERLQAEERLRQAQKMEAVGQLAGGIAHDLNNVLTAVMAHVDMAVAALPANAPLLADLTQAQSAAHRGAGMIRKLLGFSRRERLVLKPMQIGELVDEIAVTLRRMLPASIEIVATSARDMPPVAADAGAVQQMLLNIATNARDAMPAGGRLVFNVGPATPADEQGAMQQWGATGHFVVLSATDTGTGMDQAVLARIFEPYYSTKSPEQGSGLGMAMVYGLMKQHLGYVVVNSTPGKGTEVRLFFPITTDTVTRAAAPAETAPAAAGRRQTILVVEDQESVRKATIRALTRFGYEVLSAVDGEDGLQKWRANADAIDLVISDAIMPRMGGVALYEAVCAERPGARFLLMSGYTGDEMNNGAPTVADLPFLPKPWTIAELLTAVREVLAVAPEGKT